MSTSTSANSFRFLRLIAASSILLFAFAMGCEHDSRDDDNSSASSSSSSAETSSDIVGSWRLVAESGSAWYAHFDKDGNWKITDDEAGTARRVYGTYTCNGNSFSGPMINPHVGTGKIEGTFEDGSMTMDFVEYWHTPAKHVPYTGTKL